MRRPHSGQTRGALISREQGNGFCPHMGRAGYAGMVVCLVCLLAVFPTMADDLGPALENTSSAESEVPDEQLQVERIYGKSLDQPYRKYLAHRDQYLHFADYMMTSCIRKIGIGAGLASGGAGLLGLSIGMWVRGNELRDQEEAAAAQEDPDEDTGGVTVNIPSTGDLLIFFAWVPFVSGVVLMMAGTVMMALWGRRLHQMKKLHPAPVSVNVRSAINGKGNPMATLSVRF